MTTDDLPEAFKPHTMENVPPESLTNTWFAKGYNEALEATDAASLYRERNRLQSIEKTLRESFKAASDACRNAEDSFDQVHEENMRLRAALERTMNHVHRYGMMNSVQVLPFGVVEQANAALQGSDAQ